MPEEPTPTLMLVTPAYDEEPGRDAVRSRRLAMALRAAAVLRVVVSLAIGDMHRAGYYAAWDLLGSAPCFVCVGGVRTLTPAVWRVVGCYRHWFAPALLSLLAIELSWHGQELGRTVFVVFLAAALFVRPAPRVTRAVWLAAGGWAFWNVWRHPTFNSGRYSHLGFGSDAGARLHALASRFFVQDYLDIPGLFTVGLASVLLLRRHRWFWRTIPAVQGGPVVLPALSS